MGSRDDSITLAQSYGCHGIRTTSPSAQSQPSESGRQGHRARSSAELVSLQGQGPYHDRLSLGGAGDRCRRCTNRSHDAVPKQDSETRRHLPGRRRRRRVACCIPDFRFSSAAAGARSHIISQCRSRTASRAAKYRCAMHACAGRRSLAELGHGPPRLRPAKPRSFGIVRRDSTKYFGSYSKTQGCHVEYP